MAGLGPDDAEHPRHGPPEPVGRLPGAALPCGQAALTGKRKLGPIGVDLIGWARCSNRGGYGPYVVDGAATRRAAIRRRRGRSV